MNALDLLKADHQRLRDLFVAFRESAGVPEKREFHRKIKRELESHTTVEEGVFYPAFNDDEDFSELIADALEDHQEMRDILDEIDDAEEDEDFIDLMDELIDTAERHVEAEEDEFFVEVAERLSFPELEELGRRMGELRDEISEAA
ncbi:MAG: hemerythrin domain-containing protein [Oligoflexia bacterium]|nr:hemerythrin domain-containing protein [Oligoflexia bacterium]